MPKSPPLEVFAVHGINTPAPDRLTYGEQWRKLLKKGGVVANVTSGTWNSQDPASDIANVIGDAAFRAAQVKRIAAALTKWVAKTAGSPRILLAHSMGEALSLAACRAVAADGAVVDFDAITMGGPLLQPFWKPAFVAAGLLKPAPNGRVLHLWNADDPICSANGAIIGVPWIEQAEIKVAGRPTLWNPLREHDFREYLDNARVVAEIAAYL